MPNSYEDKIHKYDLIWKISMLVVVICILVGVIIGVGRVFFVGYRVDLNVSNTQQIIKDNQANTEAARAANIQRQEDLKNYIKCVVLISKKHPEINFQTATLEQTSTILDECAKSNP